MAVALRDGGILLQLAHRRKVSDASWLCACRCSTRSSSPRGRWLVTCTLGREVQRTSVEQPCTLVPQRLRAGVGGAPGLRAVSLCEASPGSEPSGCVGFPRSSAPLSPAAVPLPGLLRVSAFLKSLLSPSSILPPLRSCWPVRLPHLPTLSLLGVPAGVTSRELSGCPSESRLGVPTGVCLPPPFLLGSTDFLAVLPLTPACWSASVCRRCCLDVAGTERSAALVGQALGPRVSSSSPSEGALIRS